MAFVYAPLKMEDSAFLVRFTIFQWNPVISTIPGGEKRTHAKSLAFRSCVPQSILILSDTNSCVLCYILCFLRSCPFYQLEKNEVADTKSGTPVALSG